MEWRTPAAARRGSRRAYAAREGRSRIRPAGGRRTSALPRRSAAARRDLPLKQLAHPRGSEDGRARAEARPESPPFPPPRASVVARAERSPGFGPSLAFPVAQWRVERGGVCPLQWRGRAGVSPASECLCSRDSFSQRGHHRVRVGPAQGWGGPGAPRRPHPAVVTWRTATLHPPPHSAISNQLGTAQDTEVEGEPS
jgi:hypothetical protein